jgi:branched-chain amino acid aminotransferase
MINLNGILTVNTQAHLSFNNRAVTYGDAIFETLKIANGTILFWEDHYFRLMASMRILRMDIPMYFTMEYLEEEIFKTLDANTFTSKNARVKLFVNRVEGGLYSPRSNDVEFMIQLTELVTAKYEVGDVNYKVDLFKDHFVAPGLLSSLKSNNRILNVIASIYSEENDLDNCLLLNTNKAVIEALNGNLFLVIGNTIKTPPLNDGCIKGILRKQIIDLVKSHPDLKLIEASVSSFELQKADELFITNVIIGIQPITQYRKKRFETTTSTDLLDRLNEKIN